MACVAELSRSFYTSAPSLHICRKNARLLRNHRPCISGTHSGFTLIILSLLTGPFVEI